MTGGFALSCTYSNPLAAPAAIFILVFQSRGSLPGGRSENNIKYANKSGLQKPYYSYPNLKHAYRQIKGIKINH
jgi:hypothetical protein